MLKNKWVKNESEVDMITNKKRFLKQVKKDYPQYIDNNAIIEDAEYQLMIKDSCQVEFEHHRNVKLYDFKLLKSGNYRFV